jgi:hypothetical protein
MLRFYVTTAAAAKQRRVRAFVAVTTILIVEPTSAVTGT